MPPGKLILAFAAFIAARGAEASRPHSVAES
jgi:hypothetical protein